MPMNQDEPIGVNADRLYPLERSKRLVVTHMLKVLFDRDVDGTISTACVRERADLRR
jgi:hypothetical protein